jgi:monofunctional biosynthetic peptidoglycan transglycosylase
VPNAPRYTDAVATNRRARRWVGWLGIALLVPPLASVLQVLTVRFVDPPFTWTMVDRAWEQAATTGRWAWVDHRPLSLAELGTRVPRAVVASEDARFYLHRGFDWESICAAANAYGDPGKTVRGGSTLSQQVAKNVFLWQERSWIRKGLEVWYTVLLEALVPKDRILELYLGVAETGPMTFGVEAGAQRHFHRSAAALTATQAAQLAAVLPSPRRWTPTRPPASTRAAWILENPAPFPGDRGFDALLSSWSRTAPGPTDCWTDPPRSPK